jgi:Carboxypeptidase regulatory-like domain
MWICGRKGRHRKSRLARKKQIDAAPEAAGEMRANWTGVQVTIPKTIRRNRGPPPAGRLRLRFEVTSMRPLWRRAFIMILFAALGFSAGLSARGPIGNLTGTVVDAKGKPVADATVTMQSSDGKKPYATHTDAEGHFQFTRYETGQYDLRAYSNGMFSDWAKRISIRSQKTTEVTLRLPPPADQSVSVTQ